MWAVTMGKPISASSPQYTGRFAPSPTGPLHFGSLVSALASYLDAKSHGGQWLVRIEDIDPPREQVGASESILAALINHGLQWDGEVLYQSKRYPQYRQALHQLVQRGHVYPCSCSRQRVAALSDGYDGHCLAHPPTSGEPVAMKMNSHDFLFTFNDTIQLNQQQSLRSPKDDFVVWRKDDLVAYQLAVVVDDIAQGVTHILRGSDLFDSTVRQALIWQLLGHSAPVYGHIPVVENELGQKLSKQNHAKALDINNPAKNLYHALLFLRQSPPDELIGWSVEQSLSWACQHWNIKRVPKQRGSYYSFEHCVN